VTSQPSFDPARLSALAERLEWEKHGLAPAVSDLVTELFDLLQTVRLVDPGARAVYAFDGGRWVPVEAAETLDLLLRRVLMDVQERLRWLENAKAADAEWFAHPMHGYDLGDPKRMGPGGSWDE
jgi:hypothetical protein